MRSLQTLGPATAIACALLLANCGGDKPVKADPAAEAPPPAQVEHVGDPSIFKIDHPEKFPVVQAAEYNSSPELSVTGAVSPDVSRNIPVISLATGRVIEIHARLGDTVTKGQLLMRVQSADITQAFSDYRQALSAEKLTTVQLDRAKLLYDKGAIPKKDVEVAEDAETRAKVAVETAEEHLSVLGAEKDHPTAIVDILAPASGVITDQQITASAGVQGLSGPNPFTISDLSRVWVVCDVFENDLAAIRIGESAEIHLTAFPDKTFSGRIDNIGATLDPNLRTAKVRLEVDNPGQMRFGMFVNATFRSGAKVRHAAAPATAILHLHDREWVYSPAGGNAFKRIEVTSGKMLPGGMQEIVSGVAPGDQVVTKALVLQNSAEQ